jgi:hypothetical protein
VLIHINMSYSGCIKLLMSSSMSCIVSVKSSKINLSLNFNQHIKQGSTTQFTVSR